MKTTFFQSQFFQFHTVNSAIQQYKQSKYAAVDIRNKMESVPEKTEVCKSKAA